LSAQLRSPYGDVAERYPLPLALGPACQARVTLQDRGAEHALDGSIADSFLERENRGRGQIWRSLTVPVFLPGWRRRGLALDRALADA
jgi:hypothetical protein